MKKHFGFATSGTGITSRSELYSSTLQHLAKTVGPVIKDKLTIDQMLSLVIRNGRVDHPPGEHDGAVVACVTASYKQNIIIVHFFSPFYSLSIIL